MEAQQPPQPPPEIAAEQHRQQALALGLIIGVAALSLIVCGLRVRIKKKSGYSTVPIN